MKEHLIFGHKPLGMDGDGRQAGRCGGISGMVMCSFHKPQASKLIRAG